MVFLEINANIENNKVVEFNQSKLTFINGLQNFDGYLGFTEKPASPFLMKISWANRNGLNRFMKSEHYRVFHGALIILSNTNQTHIMKEKIIT